MLKKIAWVTGGIVLGIVIYFLFFNSPVKGAFLRHEDFRGYQVPIKADGKGGEYRWVGDVPWNVFTIEEKVRMAFARGGLLDVNDIEEIRKKYGDY